MSVFEEVVSMLNMKLSRRDTLKLGALTLATLAFPMARQSRAAANGPFTLPPLPYPTDALAPVIGEKTMTIHHGKHHQAYVDKLNQALASHPDLQSWSLEELLTRLEELPEALRKDVRNQGGGHANHSMFWESMLPPEQAKKTGPDARLAQAIERDFGSLDTFKTRFQEAGAGVFGSGWVWLAADPDGKLVVRTTPNQDSLLISGKDVPLLGNDCWEHSYYLDYQNRRPEYLKAWWDVVNWDRVSQRFAEI
jgi:Fe-Mn family superoxide dismutase